MSTRFIIRDVMVSSKGSGYATFHMDYCPRVTRFSVVQEGLALGVGYLVNECRIEAEDIESAERAYLVEFDVDFDTRRHKCINVTLAESRSGGRTYMDEGLFAVPQLARRLRVPLGWLNEQVAAFEALVIGRSIWEVDSTGEARLTKDAEIDFREFLHRRR
jgi:hypothetical protein